jgi:hypothetical protein
MGVAAVLVVAAADEEVGPLGDGAGAGDAAGVGAEVVCLAEGGVVCDAGEDEEPDEEERGREEGEAGGAQEGVCFFGGWLVDGDIVRHGGDGMCKRVERTLWQRHCCCGFLVLMLEETENAGL